MDLHIPVPPSSDGAYELADLPGPDLEFPVEPDDKFTDEFVTEPAVEVSRTTAGMTAVTNELVVEPAPVPVPSAGESKPAEAANPAEEAKPADAGPELRRKRRVVKKRWDAPAWVVSAVIHIGVLLALAAMAGSSQIIKKAKDIDSTLVSNPGSAEEMTQIYADPADVARTDLNGDTDSTTAGPGVGFSTNIGSAPSNTPAVTRTGKPVNEKTSLPTIPTILPPSGLASTTVRLNRDFGGGGMIGGDVTFAAGEVGVALDQIAREILRHLTQHKVTVVWLFDESESMRDDQKEIKKKFDRVVNELKVNAPDEVPGGKNKKSKTSGPPLSHAIVGFGEDVHFEQEKPTGDIEAISKAIDRLRIDSSGKENTMTAVTKVISHYGNLISDERKLLIVLVTDESGDDGDFVEEARQASVARNVPVYVIGRQSLFGTDHLTIEYHDPVTSDIFWVGIRRGPETADFEALPEYVGLRRRWDELPSGFAPYELARLAKDSGGIYFTLPSEEGLRIKRREKAYSINTLKEYVPDYESRAAYLERRAKSEFRRTLFEVIQETKTYPFRHHFPVYPEQLLPAIEQELPVVTIRLNALIEIEKRLRQIEKLRNREPEKRWQAAYDLMLAQVVAYQIKAYEYRANLEEMYNNPKPSQFPTETLFVDWTLEHWHERKAPKEKTEKVYKEAKRLFDLVIERHPNTPWGDLAQDEIRRGFSVKRNEWHHKHSTRYQERAKLVPKF